MVRPIVMVFAGHEIHHGERDDSEMCLCGHPCYYQCPDWLAGNATLGAMVVRSTEEADRG